MHIVDQENIPAQEVAEAAQELSNGDVVIPRAAVVPRILFVAVTTLVLGGVLVAASFAAGYWYHQEKTEAIKLYAPGMVEPPHPQEVEVSSESNTTLEPAIAEEYSSLEAAGVVFQNDDLGFSLELPAAFNQLVMTMGFDPNKPDIRWAEFTLPVSTSSEGQLVFNITKFPEGTDQFEFGAPGLLLAEDSEGYRYYFGQALGMGILPEQPEYQTFMNMVEYDLKKIVAKGFILEEN